MDIITSSNPRGVDFFCHNDKGIVRLTYYKDIPDVLWISTLVVDEIHRNKGIGTQLLNDVEDWAKQLNIKVVSLQTTRKSWLEKWYRKRGFIAVADGYEEGMVIMSKFLNVSKL